jgi:hypothetical protein
MKIQCENVVLTDVPSSLYMNNILNNANPKNFKYWSRIAEFPKEYAPVLL